MGKKQKSTGKVQYIETRRKVNGKYRGKKQKIIRMVPGKGVWGVGGKYQNMTVTIPGK